METSGPLHAATAGSIRATLAEAQERKHAERVAQGLQASPLTTFRLYTEGFSVDHIGRRKLRDIVTRRFPLGASIFYGDGLYARQSESSAVVEIVGIQDDLLSRVIDLAQDIKAINRQQSVLLTMSATNVVTI